MPGDWWNSNLRQRCLWLHSRERRVLPVDVFPEVFPDVLRHFEEYFDDLWIELPSRPEFDFLAGDIK